MKTTMISKFFRIRHFAALIAVAATMAGALSSCVTTDEPSGPGRKSDNETLTIRIDVPGNERPATRALTTLGEYDVNEIAVLAFDADDKQFHGRYSGSIGDDPTYINGTVAGATMTFEVSLPLGDFDLMVLANADSMLDAASTFFEGADRDDVLEAIEMTMGTGGWTRSDIPMWGYKTAVSVPEDFTGAHTTLSSTVRLTRMVARVDVMLGGDLVDAEKFELQSVRVYNYLEQGRLIPDLDAFDWEGATLTGNTIPTLPAPYTKADAASGEFIDFTLPQGATSLVRSIYLFEAPAGVNPAVDPTGAMKNTCLVVGGSYNGAATTYYRIDFTKDTDTNLTDDVHNWVYMPIMRNNAYFVTITDITGDGHGSQGDALASAPINIDTGIIECDNENILVAATNGVYMLGLSDDEYEFSPNAYTSASTGNELLIVTDYPDGWTSAIFDDEAGTTATNSGWLTLSQSSVSAADDPDGTPVRIIATANSTAIRTAWIHITAGAIKLKVEVVQNERGVHASPGVIGYKSDGTLTLRGSSAYAGTSVDPAVSGANDFGPLETEPVYVAYFKWGSMVATGTKLGAFSADDVVWAPADYTYGSYTGAEAVRAQVGTDSGLTAWEKVPSRTGTDAVANKWSAGAAGSALGDPCSVFGDDWAMPSGHPWNGGTFGSNTANSSATGWGQPQNPNKWIWLDELGTGLPGGARKGPDSDPDWSMFLPAAGMRQASGNIPSQNQGYYWSAAPYDVDNASVLHFLSSGAAPSERANAQYTGAMAVRCVPAPTPTPATHLVFDQTNSNPANITGHGTGPILDIIAGMRRALVKQTATGEVTIAYLDNNNSTLYADGSPADLTGAEGDVMVYKPEFWYKYVATPAGADTFGYDIAAEQPADAASWIHSPASLIGAFKSNMVGNMLYSRSGIAPTGSISQTDNIVYAQARGTGYGIIDYEQHSMIALLFYAKYGNRNSQAVLGIGGAEYTAQNGSTIGLGNGDTAGATSGHASFAGIEGMHGGTYEWVDGVTISNGVWTITDPDGAIRTVTAASATGFITEIAASAGPRFDMVPTAVGGSETTYYADYYLYGTGSNRAFARSGSGTNTLGGVSYTNAIDSSSYSVAFCASRLSFRGTIIEATSAGDFRAIPLQ